MTLENIKEMTLESETFETPRQNFNRVLQRLFKSMIESGSNEGSITLKVDVTLATEFIPNFDPEIEGETRQIAKPSFKHKVSSTVTVKDEMTGNNDPQMELVWDEQLQRYVLTYVTNTAQRSIFDDDMSWNRAQEVEEPAAISGADQKCLPGPQDYDDGYSIGDEAE
ncbi:MAG: hypothetical protein LIO54_08315 [Oscillospiraceae bacterium]|nr:hypothetical protein [Oscillospiraceae bacterium]